MIELRISEKAGEGWDELVKSLPEGTLFQTSIWADSLKKQFGADPVFLTATDENDCPVGSLLLFRTGLGNELVSKFVGPAAKISKKIFTTYSWNYGPLLMDKNRKSEILTAILNGIEGFAREKRAHSLKDILPPVHFGSFDEEIDACFIANNFIKHASATFLIDLAPPKETLWNNLDKAARKAVESCQNSGVTVERISSENELEEYLSILKSFRRRSGLLMPPIYPGKSLWKQLGGKNLDIFIAKHNGKIISGIGVVYFNGIITEIAVARTDYEFENKLYAQDLIKWRIIEWGNKNNLKVYDLGGVSPNPVTQKEKGIHQFKAKWGGTLVNYYTYSKILSRNREKLVSTVKSIRNLVRK